jgi:hypothetical protein
MTFPGLWFIVDDTRLTKGFFLMSDTKDLERQQFYNRLRRLLACHVQEQK